MYGNTRGLFRVNVCREGRINSSSGSGSSSSSGSNNTHSHPTDGSSLPQAIEYSPPSTGIYGNPDDAASSSSWGIHDMVSHVEQEEEEEEEVVVVQNQPFLPTLLTSPSLSLRGDSPFAITSYQCSLPRVRPTRELPPTTSVGDVPHSKPTALRLGVKINHDKSLSFESPSQLQISARPPAFPRCSTDPLVSSNPASPFLSPTPKVTRTTTATAPTASTPGGLPENQALLHGTTCKVCSLCGVTVLQMGTFEEQERQYREHEESWAHQKNHEMRTLLEHGGAANPTTKDVGGKPSMLSTKPKVSEELTTSPIILSSENVRHAKTSLSHALNAQPMKGESQTREQKSMPSTEMTFKPLLHSGESTPSHVQKELFCEHSQQSVSGNEDETGHRTCDDLLVTRKEMVKPVGKLDSRRHVLSNRGAGGGTESDDARSEKNAHGIGGSSGEFLNGDMVKNVLTRKKERQMEQRLNRYLIKKERHELLLCFRHWYNLMFVRIMENPTLPRRGASVKEETRMKDKEQRVPFSSSGASEGHHNFDSALKILLVEGKGKTSELPRHRRVATTNTARTKPFMETRMKGFSYLAGSSSSDTWIGEKSTTDVSWYIHPTSHRKDAPKKGRGKEDLQTSPLVDESSVEDILATLSPALRERVEMLFRDETPHAAKFPKTLCALSQVQSSTMLTVPSLWASFNVANSCEGFSEPLLPHAMPNESAVLADNGEWKRKKEEEEEKEEEGRREQQHVREEHQTSLIPQNEVMDILQGNSEAAIARQEDEGHRLCDRRDVTETKVQPQLSRATEDTLRPGNGLKGRSSRSPFVYERDDHPSGNQEENVRGQGQRILVDQGRQGKSHSSSSRLQGCVDCGRGTSFGGGSSMPGICTQPLMMGRRRKGEKRSPSILVKGQDPFDLGSESTIFRGIPGRYYIYHRGSYHRVRDPTSETYCNAKGKRMPMYFVRRPVSPMVSPMRIRPFALTRTRSPLGPSRLNPYCSVCVARYNIVLVDESMQPLTVTPQSPPLAENDDVHTHRHCRSHPCRRSVSSTPIRSHSTQYSPSEEFGPWGRGDRTPVRNCQHHLSAPRANSSRRSNFQRASPVLYAARTAWEPFNVTPLPQQSVKAEPHENVHGLSDVLQNITPEKEKWLMQQERRLRRRMKSLLWRELPQSRGSRQWVEYLSSLREVMQMLETLREGQSPDR